MTVTATFEVLEDDGLISVLKNKFTQMNNNDLSAALAKAQESYKVNNHQEDVKLWHIMLWCM